MLVTFSLHLLQITGMTCASCVSLIERTTKKLPGVYSAAVALTGRGHFEYDPHLVHPRDIIKAVEVHTGVWHAGAVVAPCDLHVTVM